MELFSWGHAVSSGISTNDAKEVLPEHNTHQLGGIDFFISSKLFEGEHNAQQRYSESLYIMNGLTTSFYPPISPPPGITREYFELPQDANIYLCPQTLYKLHPDFDNLVIQILFRDVGARVVFPIAQHKDHTKRIQQRLIKVLANKYPHVDSGSILIRIIFDRRMNYSDFIGLASLANVVLDPFPVSILSQTYLHNSDKY